MKVHDLYEKYREAKRLGPPKLAQSTLDCEQNFYKDYIDPVIGGKDSRDVTEDEILMIAVRSRSMGRQSDTLRNLRRIINRMFEYAIEIHELETNVVNNISEEYNRLMRESTYSADEVTRVYNAFEKMSLGNLYGFVAEMRCNAAEALALSEDSVMLEEGICFLDHIFVCDSTKGLTLEIKGGVTWMNLTSKAKEYIGNQLKLQAINKRRAGEKWNNVYNLIFTDGFGNPISKEVLRKENEKLIRLSGIPKLTLERMNKINMGKSEAERSAEDNTDDIV